MATRKTATVITKTGGYVWRIVLSLIVLFLVGWSNTLMTSIGAIGAGNAAGLQFNADNHDYIQSVLEMKFFSNLFIPGIFVLAALTAIWWLPLKQLFKMMATLSLIALFIPTNAQAYYDKTDYAEPYFIMPNESAFWVPDVGDNKTAQTKFGSKEYFEANKIAAKRFVIPHIKLENSGLFSNYYVPAGRLILVDRTPYSREWVDAHDRGSSNKKQGFPCQSKEGLNMTVGIAIGTSLSEDDAPTFLYRFGVNPPEGNRADPVVTFTSVLHSRSLTQVMDTVGRNKVQALVCNEISARSFDLANQQANEMMKAVRENADKYFHSVGVTLDYLGWADTINFDDAVQKAVNDAYIASKIGPVMPVLTQNAENSVKEGLGKGLATRGLPANLIAIPEHLLDLTSMFGGGSTKATVGTASK